MAEILRKKALIIENSVIIQDIYNMRIKAADIADAAKPGQFLSVYCRDGSRLLPRPISICEADKKQGVIRLVYRIAGKGTREFAMYHAGDTVEVMGPLGNGFTSEGTKALIIGGGIGIPPMLELSKQLNGPKEIVLGYRDATFLNKEFEAFGKVYLSTEDGSAGTRGNVLDAIRQNRLDADIIYACGPIPMLRGIKAYALDKGIKAQISLEERMACGIGACLGCVCRTKDIDPHSNVNNKRICKDGPVFYADEVEI